MGIRGRRIVLGVLSVCHANLAKPLAAQLELRSAAGPLEGCHCGWKWEALGYLLCLVIGCRLLGEHALGTFVGLGPPYKCDLRWKAETDRTWRTNSWRLRANHTQS